MKDFFYIDSQNQQHGPIAEDKLLEAGVQRHTLVWCNGMSDWMPADTVASLRARFEQAEQQAQAQAQATSAQTGNDSFRQQDYYQQQTPPYRAYNSYADNRPPMPDSYLVWAVLTTICCCLPFGIVAIIKANQVSGLYYRQMYDEAYLAADEAKKWTIIATLTGLVTCFIGNIFNLIYYF